MAHNRQAAETGSDPRPTWPKGIAGRPAAPADRDFLLTVFAESRPDLAAIPQTVRDQVVRLQFDSQLRQYRGTSPDAVDWVLEIECDGRPVPVGRCYLRQAAHEHRLLDLAMAAAWRGRGLGSAVLESLCGDAARAGVPLRLSVWHSNQGAIKLYRRHGFISDGAATEAEGAPPAAAGYLRLCRPVEALR